MSISSLYPSINPTLNLDFANVGALDSRVTFSRASTATYFDQLGVLQTAAINTARFDYNPSTLAAQGLLIEEQRTNSIRNNTMQGAVAGTPGTAPTNWTYGQLSTLSTQIVGFGTETGINYVDIRIFGTATTTPLIYFEANSTIAATNNQTWATSTFVKIVGGGTTNITVPTTTLRMSDSGGGNLGFIAGSAYTLPTSATPLSACRFSSSHTTNNASTAFVMPAFAFNSSGAIDITLRIGLPQLEQGAFATSVIPTTTTALTRSADVASMTGTNFSSWFNASEGTLFVSSIPSNVTASNFANWAIGDSTLAFGAANTIYNLYTSGLTGRIGVNAITAGASQVSNLTPSYTQNANTLTKSATAYKLNDYAHSVNGIAPATDTSATVPAVTSMSIGGLQSGWSGATNYLNGYIQRISYYPTRLTNAQLQALTL